jgi:Xaa-Pro aminopeptidase
LRGRVAILLLALAPAACATAQESVPKTKAKPVAPERLRPTDSEALRASAFAPEVLAKRRRALVKKLGANAVLVVATGKRGSDILPFRPDPNFLYLSGQRDAGLSLMVTANEDVLFAPSRNRMAEAWNGPSLAVGTDLARAAGFGEVVNRSSRAKRVEQALAAGGKLYLSGLTLGDLSLANQPEQGSPAQALARARQVKDAGEVTLLQRAIDITAAALTEAIRSIEPGQFEYEAQGTIEYLFTRYGAQRPGFVSIVGSGPNSCILHYSSNRRQMAAGELVVMDVGAELWGYTADVTRTVPTSGTFSPRQREIYEVVLRAQQAGFEAVKPGSTMRAVDRAARQVIQDAGYGQYFLHGTSHWLGLDVHDVGVRARLLEPGMLLTVEPGIYIAEENLGVRIEDDVLVTKTGRRVLSDGIPRTVSEIEALMRDRGVGDRRVAPLPRREVPKDAKKRERIFQLR